MRCRTIKLIEPLRLRDIRAVHQLEQEIFPKDAYPYLDLAFLLLTPWMINRKIEDEGGKLVGFIAVADALLWRRTAWVITVGVAQAWQNRGIGRHLMQAVEPLLSAHSIRLTVRMSNAPAIHLYHKVGYSVLKTHRGYYRDGEDGIIMGKTLTHP